MPLQYRVNWDYGEGAPGVSVFHGRGGESIPVGSAAQHMADDIAGFFTDIRSLVPSSVSWTFPSEVLELDTTTGDLEDVHAVTAPTTVTASGGNGYAAPAGTAVRWFTAAIVEGRRLQGRTYLVPLSITQYATDGSIQPGTITTLNTAAGNLIDEGLGGEWNFSVWSRTHGIQADVLSHLVQDRVSVLRSRRD
jgi:hypothetical protein